MKKAPYQFLLLGLCIILLFVASCDSDSPSGPGATSCGDPSDRLMRVSFNLDGKLYNLDSVGAFFGTNMIYASNDSTAIDFERQSAMMYYQLLLSLPSDKSGTFTWQKSTTYLKGYGCFIEVDSIAHLRLTPESGSTTIKWYGEDSVYGVFCGQLKDSLGGTHEVTGGRFYYIFN